jgi:hypothetical protein
MASRRALVLAASSVLGATSVGLAGCRESGKNSSGLSVQSASSLPTSGSSVAAPPVCGTTEGRIVDPRAANIFPPRTSGYCIDPRGETRSYGKDAKLPLDGICLEAFDGECESYKELGVERVVQFQYIDGSGKPGTIEVYLSQFANVEGAFAMFTQRVTGDADPERPNAPRRVESSGGVAALGTGRADVWRGEYLAEITYSNEEESVEQVRASTERVLGPLAAVAAARMPGSAGLPLAAALLPTERLLPFGMISVHGDVLGARVAGPGAIGFYRDGGQRYRILAIARDSEDRAKETLSAFRRVRGAAAEGRVAEGVRLTVANPPGPALEWVVARAGQSVVGIGDDAFALRSDAESAPATTKCLASEEKVRRLRALLSALSDQGTQAAQAH